MLLAAFEASKYNGPWEVPDHLRKLNGVLRYSQGTATDGFTLSAMAYSNGWNSTDQVPQRAIDRDGKEALPWCFLQRRFGFALYCR